MADALANRVRLFAHVQPDVITIGLDPINVAHFHEKHPPVMLHENATGKRRGCTRCSWWSGISVSVRCRTIGDTTRGGQQFPQTICCAALIHLGACSLKGRTKAIGVDRFQHIIHRMYVKRPQRVFIVRGHKQNERHGSVTQFTQYAKAIQFWHLHIEAHNVRLQLGNTLHRFATSGCLANHFDIGFGLQEASNALSRQRFIIDNQHAYV